MRALLRRFFILACFFMRFAALNLKDDNHIRNIIFSLKDLNYVEEKLQHIPRTKALIHFHILSYKRKA